MGRARSLGLVYELLRPVEPGSGLPPDAFAEYEPIATIEGIEAAARRLGLTPVRLGGPADWLDEPAPWRRIVDAGVDVVFNIAEGFGTRNREAWAPVLLEMSGIPYLGSDALTLSTSLDKHWTKLIVEEAGVAAVPGISVPEGREVPPLDDFPRFVKPRYEGTSKGIRRDSKVGDATECQRAVARIERDYRQPALVEAFLPGAEYTVTVIGNDSARALPVLQRALDPRSGIGLHAVSDEAGADPNYDLPGELSPELEKSLGDQALCAFHALGCRDFARVDFRLDERGDIFFLEINPLPTFAPDGSFGVLAELEGLPPEALVSEAISAGLTRLGLTT